MWMRWVVFLLIACFVDICSAQTFDFNRYTQSPLNTRRDSQPAQKKPLADLRANPYDRNSLQNPYGAGNPYRSDGLMNPYSRNGSLYSNESWRNPYAQDPPKMSNGGRLSTNPYLRDSTSNPYGTFGNPYSRESLSNPYGAGNPYEIKPLFVYPGIK
jgi:hypothetical protein